MKLFPGIIAAFILSFALNCLVSAQSGGTVKESLNISSKYLHGVSEYSVYLPPSYSVDSQKKFGLMYLLHGYGGNENSWIRRCKIKSILDSLISENAMPELIVIMPDAKNSYYINDYLGKFNYEDYFIKELLPHINQNFRIDSSKKPAICGLSMGGFGAIILPVKHPEIFSHSISLSPAVRTPKIFSGLPQEKYNSYFGNLFGHDLASEERITEHWKKNSPFFMIDSSNVSNISNTKWYIDCGMYDFLFPANRAFHNFLLDFNVPHEFHMRIGKHNWEYWRKGFILAMIYLKDNF